MAKKMTAAQAKYFGKKPAATGAKKGAPSKKPAFLMKKK